MNRKELIEFRWLAGMAPLVEKTDDTKAEVVEEAVELPLEPKRETIEVVPNAEMTEDLMEAAPEGLAKFLQLSGMELPVVDEDIAEEEKLLEKAGPEMASHSYAATHHADQYEKFANKDNPTPKDRKLAVYHQKKAEDHLRKLTPKEQHKFHNDRGLARAERDHP